MFVIVWCIFIFSLMRLPFMTCCLHFLLKCPHALKATPIRGGKVYWNLHGNLYTSMNQCITRNIMKHVYIYIHCIYTIWIYIFPNTKCTVAAPPNDLPIQHYSILYPCWFTSLRETQANYQLVMVCRGGRHQGSWVAHCEYWYWAVLALLACRESSGMKASNLVGALPALSPNLSLESISVWYSSQLFHHVSTSTSYSTMLSAWLDPECLNASICKQSLLKLNSKGSMCVPSQEW